jgi:hypothetical protein
MAHGRSSFVPAALWLAIGVPAATGCHDRYPPASTSAGSAPVATTPHRRLRRLSNREYDNLARDLLGDSSRPASRFLADSYPNGYDNGSAGLAAQSDQVAAYQAAAEMLAAGVLANNRALVLGACEPAGDGEPVCLDAVLARFAARAYRRPLSGTEKQRLRELFQAERVQGGFDQALQAVLEVILQSPQFLYREELGAIDAVPEPGAGIDLTDHELASELSFLLTGSIPDAELWTAVEQGRFGSASERHAQALRLLATPAAHEAIRAFLHQWLATRRLATLSKSPGVYPTFNAALANSMSAELDGFFDDVLWSRSGSLRELFTSNRSFADADLGQLYGVDLPGPGFQAVTLDPQLRAGILTRAGFLAVHADTDSSGPIARGVFILSAIVCQAPSPPPPNIPPAPSPTDPGAPRTTRQRFDQHVSSGFCAACHTQIDGIGFGFEAYDGIGAYRTVDNGLPVDDRGTVIGLGTLDGDFAGAGELAARLAGSQALSDCFARQVYRYALGQVEGQNQDVAWLTSAATPDARITDLLLTIVDSSAFSRRVFE